MNLRARVFNEWMRRFDNSKDREARAIAGFLCLVGIVLIIAGIWAHA